MSATLTLIVVAPALLGQIYAPPVPIRTLTPPIVTVRPVDLNTSLGGSRVPTDLGLKSTLPGNGFQTPTVSNTIGNQASSGTNDSSTPTSYGSTTPSEDLSNNSHVESVIAPPPPQEVHESPPDGGDDDDDDDEKPAGRDSSFGWKVLGGLAVLGLGLYGFLQPRA